MISDDDRFAWTWQARCTLMLIRFIERSPDPEEKFHQWMEEQAEGDWELLEYAAKAWIDLRDCNFLQRATIQAQCYRWLNEYDLPREL